MPQGQEPYPGQIDPGLSELDLQHEEAAREYSESLLRGISATAPAGLLVVDDRDGRILHFNNLFCRIYGIERLEDRMRRGDAPAAEIVAECARRLTDAESMAAMLRPCGTASDAAPAEDEIAFPDGRVVRRHSAPLHAPDGHYIGRLYGFEDITGRKRDEERLRESEELHRSIFEASPDGIVVATLDGTIRFVSPAAARMFGCRAEDAAGRSALEFIAPAGRERAARGLALLLRGENGGPGEFSGLHSDGQTFPIEVNGRLLHTAGGLPSGIVLICRDFTFRRAMEVVLRLQQERLAINAERTPMAYVEIDTEGRTTFWNSAAERIFGFSREEILGRSALDLLLPPEARPVIMERLKGLTAQTCSQRSTNENITSDGRRIICDWYSTPLVDAPGNVIGVAGLAQDVTEQTHDREQLAFQAQIMAQIGEPVIGASPEANVTYWNRAAEALYGWKAEEVMGRNLVHVIPVIGAPITRENALALLAGGTAWEGDVVHLDRAGNRIPVHVMATPFRNPDGAVVGFISIIRDLRARKRAEELALRSSRLESTATLAGGIAHDFNNLMTVVLGHAELLGIRLANRPDFAESVAAILEAGREGGRLAQQLLAFARGGQYVIVPVDLNDTVRAVTKDAAHPAIDIVTKLEERLWRVNTDPRQMRQMLENMVRNAVEAIAGPGTITITTANIEAGDEILRAHPDLQAVRHVRLAVEDTGCGMDAATLSRAFEPFFSTKGPGRGLGLAAAYGISKNQGGAIRGWSEPGSGSGFEVLLPAMDPVPPAATRARVVLVVENEPALARLAETVLSEAGYRVLLAAEPGEAARTVRRAQPPIDLVLLALPPSRPEAHRAFHRLRTAGGNLKILLCGLDGPDAIAAALLKAGAARFIAKPYRMDDLCRAVREALES